MGFQRTVPKNSTELFEYLTKIHENQSHVKSVQVNHTSGHLEIDLDWAANNMGGYPDVYLPIKRAKINDAKLLVERMMSQSKSGFVPSRADAAALFDLIDPQGK